MDSPAAGHVQHPQPAREHTDERRSDRRESEGEQRRTGQEDRGGRHRGHDNDSYAFGIPDQTVFLDSGPNATARDRKSTRLNSSHVESSYAVFCLKKKKTTIPDT